MNEILDEDLTAAKKPKSMYGKYSNLPAALVILGSLFKVMHWPYGEFMLLIGICGHFGIELGYAIALKFSSKINNRRLVIATFFFVFLSGFWRLRIEDLYWFDYVLILIIVVSITATYLMVKSKIKKKDSDDLT
jgi:hypothetical protein